MNLQFVVLALSAAVPMQSGTVLPALDRSVEYRVELPADSPVGEASIREHAITWDSQRQKYYLVGDVIPLDNPHHPNTYDTEIHLWSSEDLSRWTYHGVAIRKGGGDQPYDRYGVASPAGMVAKDGRLYVPFSARRTPKFTQRGIGLAWSGPDPERLPWAKSSVAVSDTPGEDDDPAVLLVPGDDRLHLYHRQAGPNGYRIGYTSSAEPRNPRSWPTATAVTARPDTVRAQELTAAFVWDGLVHMMVMEHLFAGGVRIAHLTAARPEGPFEPADPDARYLAPEAQPQRLAYNGHITPVKREGRLIAFFWTVPQAGARYGLLGHPLVEDRPAR